jgi:hypothetical protein
MIDLQRLESLGPAGLIAAFAFRVQQASDEAKDHIEHRFNAQTGAEYGRAASRDAYGSKNWAMQRLYFALVDYADQLGITWGWRSDPKTPSHPHVLYIDLPTGQVSFHAEHRGHGPDYPAEWDGTYDIRDRIQRWVDPTHRGSAVSGPGARTRSSLTRIGQILVRQRSSAGELEELVLIRGLVGQEFARTLGRELARKARA